jgi:L-amino acid N-acyltransferase YncA
MKAGDPTQRQLISFLVLVLCGAALFAIAEILSGTGIDENTLRVLLSAAALSFFLLTGVAGRALETTRPQMAWFGTLTVLVAVLGLLLALIAIWFARDDGDAAKAAGVLAVMSLALGHSSILLRTRRAEDSDLTSLVSSGTIFVVFLLTTGISVDILNEDDSFSAQVLAVLAVLYALGTLLLPLVRRLGPPGTVTSTAASAPGPVHESAATSSVREPWSTASSAATSQTSIRPSYAADAEAIAAIYNQGIEERQATFQTRRHDPGELELKTEQRGGHLIVAERDGQVAGWASWVGYDDPAEYYAGVAECAVYVDRGKRGGGVGAALLQRLAEESPTFGIHKLIAKIFTTNQTSIALFRRCGFRDVGTHLRHGRLDGDWKDVVVMERSLPD